MSFSRFRSLHWVLALFATIILVAASGVTARAQDDPLAGGDPPKVGSTTGGDESKETEKEKEKEKEKEGEHREDQEHAATSDANSFQPAMDGISQTKAMGWVYLGAAAAFAYLLGWLVLRLIIKGESPGNAGCFGCFTSAALLLGFLTMVFFGWIAPGALPEWLVWSVVGLIGVALIVMSIRLTGARRIIALLVGIVLLGGLVFLWMSRPGKAPSGSEVPAATDSVEETAKAPADATAE
ncbi:MAG: hypothetical protein K1X67_24960 [Fimbriimonadaceae bacterium]|nr:hypothetical protein [Fimbriimonadaceae bacterium]